MKQLILFPLLLFDILFFCRLAPCQTPSVVTVPFQLVRNLVVVEAKVDGVPGLFIVDTGASGVILNGRFFTGIPTGKSFYSVLGAISEEKVAFIRLDLGGFRKKECAVVTDFSVVEQATGLSLSGVIGNSFFSKCQVVFDYVFRELTIYELDKNGTCTCPKPLHQTPLDTLRFSLKGSMPCVEVTAGGRKLKMGLDSGASVCVLEESRRGRLKDCFSALQGDSLAGFGNAIKAVNAARFGQIEVGKLPCPAMKTVFVSLTDFNEKLTGPTLDGILGYEFLSQFRVAINFRKKEIYLWDLPTVEWQWAQGGLMPSKSAK